MNRSTRKETISAMDSMISILYSSILFFAWILWTDAILLITSACLKTTVFVIQFRCDKELDTAIIWSCSSWNLRSCCSWKRRIDARQHWASISSVQCSITHYSQNGSDQLTSPTPVWSSHRSPIPRSRPYLPEYARSRMHPFVGFPYPCFRS